MVPGDAVRDVLQELRLACLGRRHDELGDRVVLASRRRGGRLAAGGCGGGGAAVPAVSRGAVGGRTVRCAGNGGFFACGGLFWCEFWVVQVVCSLLSLPAALSPRSLASWVRWAHSGARASGW